MDTETLASLLTISSCVIPFCAGVLGFVALGVLLVWFVRRQWQPRSESALAGERQGMSARLARLRARLRPWSPDGLGDLSTDWDASWSRFGRALNAHGSIPALSDPKGPDWAAFSLKVRGARHPTGQLLACTTAQSFSYRITTEGVTLQADGAPWGSILPDGTLLDDAGQPIGSAPRPGGMPARFNLGSVAYLRDERERSYPVTLRGRVVGRLAHPSAQMTNVISLKKRQFPPAVVPEGVLSAEEATWLLALAILQVAGYNLLETVWTNHSAALF